MFPKQLALPLNISSPYEKKTFLRFPCHKEALSWVESWPNWPFPFICLYGPKGSGKTHLAHLWQQRSQAIYLTPNDVSKIPFPKELITHTRTTIVLDDADMIEDNPWLFHFYNDITEQKAFVLFCAKRPPSTWPTVYLPDLASRLSTIPSVTIPDLDDASLSALLRHLLKEQGLSIAPDALEYLLKRIDRSFESTHKIAKTIHYYALAYHKQRATLPFVRSMLMDTEEEKKAS